MKAQATMQVRCERCKATFLLPQSETSIREQVASLVRDEHPALATKILHDRTGLDLKDCKGVVLHITRKKSQCHRCKKAFRGDGQIVCENCGSLNLDW